MAFDHIILSFDNIWKLNRKKCAVYVNVITTVCIPLSCACDKNNFLMCWDRHVTISCILHRFGPRYQSWAVSCSITMALNPRHIFQIREHCICRCFFVNNVDIYHSIAGSHRVNSCTRKIHAIMRYPKPLCCKDSGLQKSLIDKP